MKWQVERKGKKEQQEKSGLKYPAAHIGETWNVYKFAKQILSSYTMQYVKESFTIIREVEIIKIIGELLI